MSRSPRTRRAALATVAATTVLAALGGFTATAGAADGAVERPRLSASAHTPAGNGVETVRSGKGGKGAAKESSLTGSAKMYREDGQRVRFSFDAHGFAPKDPEPGTPPGTSRGTFRFSHFTADGKQGAHFEGRIDCLLTGGPVATATGVILRSDHPDRRVIGKRVGFTVYDNGKHDRLGYSWAVDAIPTMNVPKCLSAAPYETVESGDFTVRHVMPTNEDAGKSAEKNAGKSAGKSAGKNAVQGEHAAGDERAVKNGRMPADGLEGHRK
ncbi:hypothetical protein [Streptomyces sp. NPDC003077]|uniref:hypothetical protein n=1 Tax=Streptomyces sp. NPDC003077 TaxID=3154443 RepID=UPI0033A28E7E